MIYNYIYLFFFFGGGGDRIKYGDINTEGNAILS